MKENGILFQFCGKRENRRIETNSKLSRWKSVNSTKPNNPGTNEAQ